MYNNFLDRYTDVTIPIYKIPIDEFKKVWTTKSLYGPQYDEICGYWRDLIKKLYEEELHREIISNYDKEVYPCDGNLVSKSSVAFLNDIDYINTADISDEIESPGIYIKDPLDDIVDTYLFEFILAFNIHLAETHYIYNRNVANNLYDYRFKMIEHLLVSFSTLRSIQELDTDLAMKIRERSKYLAGSWKVPFILMDMYSIGYDMEQQVSLSNNEFLDMVYDMLSGDLNDVSVILKRSSKALKEAKGLI